MAASLKSIFQASAGVEQLWAKNDLKGTPEDFAVNLGFGLPGDKRAEMRALSSGLLETEIRAREPGASDDAVCLKVSVNPSDGTAKLHNFFITDSQQRGQGIGRQAIANFYNELRSSTAINRINLTAELDCGAWVWAKMGWLPNDADFRRLQRNCLQKLEALQESLPADCKIDSDVYNNFRTLLDRDKTTDRRMIWPLVDSNVKVTVKDEQGNDKEMRLGFFLMQFESYRGELSFSNVEQVARLEDRLGDKVIPAFIAATAKQNTNAYGSPKL